MSSPQPTNNQLQFPVTFKELLERKMQELSSKINCVTLGQIVSFDTTKQTAIVSISFKRTLRGTKPIPGISYATDETIDYVQLSEVPVIVLSGGGANITMPISGGESCLILVNDRDMDTWMETGVAYAPNSTRLHDLNDAVALVGLSNYKNAIQDYFGGVLNLDCWWTRTEGSFTAGNGFDGTFATADGRVCTVSGGIIVSIA